VFFDIARGTGCRCGTPAGGACPGLGWRYLPGPGLRAVIARRVSGHRNGLAGTVSGCRRHALSSLQLLPRAGLRAR
jgi:hypothetical protein